MGMSSPASSFKTPSTSFLSFPKLLSQIQAQVSVATDTPSLQLCNFLISSVRSASAGSVDRLSMIDVTGKGDEGITEQWRKHGHVIDYLTPVYSNLQDSSSMSDKLSSVGMFSMIQEFGKKRCPWCRLFPIVVVPAPRAMKQQVGTQTGKWVIINCL